MFRNNRPTQHIPLIHTGLNKHLFVQLFLLIHFYCFFFFIFVSVCFCNIFTCRLFRSSSISVILCHYTFILHNVIFLVFCFFFIVAFLVPAVLLTSMYSFITFFWLREGSLYVLRGAKQIHIYFNWTAIYKQTSERACVCVRVSEQEFLSRLLVYVRVCMFDYHLFPLYFRYVHTFFTNLASIFTSKITNYCLDFFHICHKKFSRLFVANSCIWTNWLFLHCAIE